MRARLCGLLGSVLVVVACSSSDAPAPAGNSSTTPTASVTMAPSAAPTASAAPSAGAAGAPALRDADAELKKLDPLVDGPDSAQRLLTALALCGAGAQGGASWGRDGAPPAEKVEATRCDAAMHAKLLLKSASLKADSTEAEKRKTAEREAALALALDPAVALPAGANAAATALYAAAKKGPARFGMNGSTPVAKLGAVTTSDEATKKELEATIAGEVSSAVRFCYRLGLFDNPNLQGRIAISAIVAADGRLSAAMVTGDLPDESVYACVAAFANRSKVAPPSKTPVKVNIPFALSPAAG